MNGVSDSVLELSGSDPEEAVFFFSGLHAERRFHFSDVTKDADYYRVYVRDLFNVWYHKGLLGHTTNINETTDFLNDMIRNRGFKRVAFVGISAGGFAAILFGKMVGVSVVHAFSPRTFIDIGRWLRYADFRRLKELRRLYASGIADKILDLKPVLLQTNGVTKYFIHYCSSMRLDRIHASRLKQSMGVKLYAYRCHDHNVAAYLLNTHRTLSRILEVREVEHMHQMHMALDDS